MFRSMMSWFQETEDSDDINHILDHDYPAFEKKIKNFPTEKRIAAQTEYFEKLYIRLKPTIKEIYTQLDELGVEKILDDFSYCEDHISYQLLYVVIDLCSPGENKNYHINLSTLHKLIPNSTSGAIEHPTRAPLTNIRLDVEKTRRLHHFYQKLIAEHAKQSILLTQEQQGELLKINLSLLNLNEHIFEIDRELQLLYTLREETEASETKTIDEQIDKIGVQHPELTAQLRRLNEQRNDILNDPTFTILLQETLSHTARTEQKTITYPNQFNNTSYQALDNTSIRYSTRALASLRNKLSTLFHQQVTTEETATPTKAKITPSQSL